MPASRENLKLCENCKRVLLTLLVQDARQEFCSEFCTHEWCAKQIDGMVSGNVHEVIDRVKLYMAAIKTNQGIMAALSALIVAAHVCWPRLTPSALPRGLEPVDAADKTPPLPPLPTLFREQDEASAAAAAAEPSPTEQAEPTAATPAASSVAPADASAPAADAAGVAQEETAS